MIYEDIKNLIKNHDLTTVIMSSLWQTYVRTERLLNLCDNIGLHVEGIVKDEPSFGELYSIQSSVIEGVIALSNLDIDDGYVFEKASNMLADLFKTYSEYEIFNHEMMEYCEKKHHITFG
jgi:hypothetical protein